MDLGQKSRTTRALMVVVSLGLTASAAAEGPHRGVRGALGPRFEERARPHGDPPRRCSVDGSPVLHWNEVAIDASGLDHTPVSPGEDRVYGEQLGPTRTSRAMAIVHIAMFECVNAVVGGYQSYVGLPHEGDGPSVEAAVGVAARDTLVALYPSQAPHFNQVLAEDLARVRDRHARDQGLRLGHAAAAAILARRSDDGSQIPDPRIGVDFFTSDAPGQWRMDPISKSPLALGAYWGALKPFVMRAGDQFRAPTPPAITSPEYAATFNVEKAIGGDGVVTPTIRTDEQTFIGTFWAYDGTPSMCAPPRMYNQIAVHIARQEGTALHLLETARLLALVNVALADAAIAVWDSKYFFNYWRPVTAIREADAGTGPSGLGDGNPHTSGDPTYTPLGAPASNLQGPNFTPPFPSYPSGHAGFGGALFETLRRFYGTDDLAFTFVSDEYNGVTVDNQGQTRPLIPRSFSSLSQAEDENGQSRLYLGIHFQFDKDAGIAQGRSVGGYVYQNAFGARGGEDREDHHRD